MSESATEPVASGGASSPGAARGSAASDPVTAAVSDLAERLDVPPGAVTVVLREDVTWNDGALGCPEPGRSYTQALVEGYRVVLTVDGRRFAYHGADGHPPRLCAQGAAPSGPA